MSFYGNIALSFYHNIARQNRSSDEGQTVSNLQSGATESGLSSPTKKIESFFFLTVNC
jgi:hypothetical protein